MTEKSVFYMHPHRGKKKKEKKIIFLKIN